MGLPTTTREGECRSRACFEWVVPRSVTTGYRALLGRQRVDGRAPGPPRDSGAVDRRFRASLARGAGANGLHARPLDSTGRGKRAGSRRRTLKALSVVVGAAVAATGQSRHRRPAQRRQRRRRGSGELLAGRWECRRHPHRVRERGRGHLLHDRHRLHRLRARRDADVGGSHGGCAAVEWSGHLREQR